MQKRGGNTRGGRGVRQPQTPNRIWVEQPFGQQFFRVDKWKKIFPVATPQQDRVQVDEIVFRAERQLAAQVKAIEEFQQYKEIGYIENRYEANGWLERTGWVSHLAQYTRDELEKFVVMPKRQAVDGEVHPSARDDDDSADEGFDEVEPDLWRACQSTFRVTQAAKKASHPSVVGLAALQYVNRRETGQKNSEKPFYGRQMGKTIRKYVKYWYRILCYVWRTHDDVDPVPVYRLTTQQKRCLHAFRQSVQDTASTAERRRQVDNACLAWWISVLDHPLGDHQDHSVMVSGMAVLGWDGASRHWRVATAYTPVISAIVTVARMLVIYQAKQTRDTAVQQLRNSDIEEDEAEEKAPSHFSLVQEMVQRFMTMVSWEGQPSPIAFLLSLRTYGFTIHYNTPGNNIISWHRDEVHCSGIRFTMSSLRRTIHGLVHSTREQLLRDLLLLQLDPQGHIREGTTGLPPLDLYSLVDNPSQIQEGFSFLRDARNQFSVPGETWLFRRVVSEVRLRQKWVDVDTETADDAVAWQTRTITRYFRAVKRFKRDLYALVHMSNGGPWRGSEGLTVQHRNSATVEGRGIFISDGMVQFTTGYHKGYGHSGKPKIIHRFVPREVGELVVYFLWLVQPFVEIMQGFRDRQLEFGPFLWEPDPTTGEHDEEEDEAFAELVEGDDEISDPTLAQFEVEAVGDDEAARDSDDNDGEGRSNDTRSNATASAQAMNVDGFWDSSTVRYALQRVSRVGMDVRMTIRAWRHIVKAIIREYSQDREIREIMNEDHDMEVRRDDFHDRQFGHSGHIAGILYGRDLMENPMHTVSERESFRRVSVEWHRFLQFPSSQRSSSSKVWRDAVEVAPDIQNGRIRRLQQLQRVDLRGVLRQLVNHAHAEFRGQQEEALQAIVHRVSPIVVVMGTSAGKSALFMLPTSISPHGMTVVVVPVISLRQDLADRCQRAGIRCVEWNAAQPADGAQIVLVTPESTTTSTFQTFMNRQRALGVLDRIVVDECHVILESVDGWRPKVRALVDLTQYRVQLVYLTATLEPAAESTFYRMTSIVPAQVRMIRGATTRENIRYQVMPYNVKETEEVLQCLVERLQRQYPLPGQIIVYCPTVAQTESFATLLGCVAYHRNVGNEQEKREILRRLVSGEQQVFTATNALGLGIDRQSIRVVIHVGVPRQMRSFAQESGRAGRDGLPSESIIMRPGYTTTSHEWRANGEDIVEEAMRQFIHGAVCRRVTLDGVMDGRDDRMGCEEGEESCDVCRPSTTTLKRGYVDEIEEGTVDKRARRKLDTPESEVFDDDSGFVDVPVTVTETETVEFDAHEVRQEVALATHRTRRCDDAREAWQLETVLDRWQDRCPVCVVYQQETPDHALSACPHAMANEVRCESQQCRQQIRYERFAVCFHCHLPQEICDRWVRQPYGGFRCTPNGRCQYTATLMFDVVATVLSGEHGFQAWIPTIQAWLTEDEGETATQQIIASESEEMRWYGRQVV